MQGENISSICGNLGQILKPKTPQVFLQQKKNFWIMQKKI